MDALQIILWMAAIGAVLGALVLAFCWVLVKREVSWWEDRVAAYQKWFGKRTPSSGNLLQNMGLLAAAWVVFALALALFYSIAQLWPGPGGLAAIDQAIYAAVESDPTGWLVTVLAAITRLADVLTVCIITAIVAAFLLWHGHGWTTWALGMTTIGGMGMTWLMKRVTDRARPDGGLIGTAGESFPSGHSSLSVLIYGFLIFLTWRFIQVRWVQVALTTIFVLIIATVGVSRIVLSVHWFSDVIAGYILGLTWMLYSLATTRVLREASRVAIEK